MYLKVGIHMENKLNPVIKWVGGKRQLLNYLVKYMPKQYNTYFEPFVGGGAFLLELLPTHAVINDANAELINMYRVIKNQPQALIKQLMIHKENNSKDYYLKIREVDRTNQIMKYTDVQRAARLMYMLRVDFNGMYRVNRKGQFNVPYGKYANPNIVNSDAICKLSEYFNYTNITILCGDFANAVKTAKRNDLVYFDPPYIPLTKTSSFTSYTANNFELDDQKRLATTFFDLASKGVKVMLSNSDTALTRKLYANAHIHEVKANRMINSNGSKRGKISELIITSY